LGKDAIIDQERIRAGSKLVTKLWNVARFCERFLSGFDPSDLDYTSNTPLSPADRWILARINGLVLRCTELWQKVDYATVKSEVELFFWRDLADNYLEMAKQRLYDGINSNGAKFTLYESLLTTMKLLAPIIPHVTDHIYVEMFAHKDGAPSIHRSVWPESDRQWLNETALDFGQTLLAVASAVRRYKNDNSLSLGTELSSLYLITTNKDMAQGLEAARFDLTASRAAPR